MRSCLLLFFALSFIPCLPMKKQKIKSFFSRKEKEQKERRTSIFVLPNELIECIVEYTLDDLSFETFDKRLFSLQGLPRAIYFDVARPTYLKELRAISSEFFTSNFKLMLKAKIGKKVSGILLDSVSSNSKIALQISRNTKKKEEDADGEYPYTIELIRQEGDKEYIVKKRKQNWFDFQKVTFPAYQKLEGKLKRWFMAIEPESSDIIKNTKLTDFTKLKKPASRSLGELKRHYGNRELVKCTPTLEFAQNINYSSSRRGLFCEHRGSLFALLFLQKPKPKIVDVELPIFIEFNEKCLQLFFSYNQPILIWQKYGVSQLYYSYTAKATGQQVLFKYAVCKAFLNKKIERLLLLSKESHEYFSGIQELVMCNWCRQLAAELIGSSMWPCKKKSFERNLGKMRNKYKKDFIFHTVLRYIHTTSMYNTAASLSKPGELTLLRNLLQRQKINSVKLDLLSSKELQEYLQSVKKIEALLINKPS